MILVEEYQIVEILRLLKTGGPSGGCIPKEHLDTPIDYESLKGLVQ